MNIFKFELKLLLPSIIRWGVSLGAILLFYIYMYPTLESEMATFFEKLPKEYLIVLGLGDLVGYPGFYNFIAGLMFSLGMGVQAMSYGLLSLSKETRHKTADFLLTKPIKRTTIVTAKLSASVLAILCTWLIIVGFTSLGQQLFVTSVGNETLVMLLNVGVLLFALLMLSIGLLLSATLPKIKSVVPLSMSIVISFYLVKVLQGTVEKDWLLYFSPFQYFNDPQIIQNAMYDWGLFSIGILLIVLCIVSSYIIYQRKDIHAV